VGIADAIPRAAIADAIAPPSTANTSPVPSATGSADAPAATPTTALAAVAAGPSPVTVPADASPSDVNVLMYTASWCDVCKRAEAFMTRRGIPFEERDVTASTVWDQELHQLNPGGGVPTFDVDGNVMVGFDPRWLLVNIRRAVLKKAQGAGL
jgi:glutaredoxin